MTSRIPRLQYCLVVAVWGRTQDVLGTGLVSHPIASPDAESDTLERQAFGLGRKDWV